MKTYWDAIEANAPELLTRKKIYEITGGIISEKTLANLDCAGSGITPRLRVGGKVVYPRGPVFEFLKQRSSEF